MNQLKEIIAKTQTKPVKIKSGTKEYAIAYKGVVNGYLTVESGIFFITELGEKYLNGEIKPQKVGKKPVKLKFVLEQARNGFISTTEYSRIVVYAYQSGWLRREPIDGNVSRYCLTPDGVNQLELISQ